MLSLSIKVSRQALKSKKYGISKNKKPTQVKYKYSKTVLKSSTQLNVLRYCPPLLTMYIVQS